MKMRGLLILCCAILALVVSAAWADTAGSKSELEPVAKPAPPAKSAEVTLVGRGSRAAEVTKDGQVKEVTPGKVPVGKPVVKIVVVPGKQDAKAAEDAAQDLEQEKKEAAQEALKQADVDEIKKLRDSQRMWFFDESGKVMSKEDLDKRIKEGNVSGIKAVDDDRNEWTPKSDQQPTDQPDPPTKK